jgi:hypothetical protein
MNEGMRICVFSIFDTSTDLLNAEKSYDMGPLASFPIRRKVCCGFLSPSASAGFEPETLASSGNLYHITDVRRIIDDDWLQAITSYSLGERPKPERNPAIIMCFHGNVNDRCKFHLHASDVRNVQLSIRSHLPFRNC